MLTIIYRISRLISITTILLVMLLDYLIVLTAEKDDSGPQVEIFVIIIFGTTIFSLLPIIFNWLSAGKISPWLPKLETKTFIERMSGDFAAGEGRLIDYWFFYPNPFFSTLHYTKWIFILFYVFK